MPPVQGHDLLHSAAMTEAGARLPWIEERS